MANAMFSFSKLSIFLLLNGAVPLTTYNQTQMGVRKKYNNSGCFSQRSLKNEIEMFTPPKNTHVEEAKIVIIGPVRAGKSSFFNTVDSALLGDALKNRAASGSAEQSITSKFRMYGLRTSASVKPLNFRLCDTQGLETDQRPRLEDIEALLDGHVPDEHEMSEQVSRYIRGYKKNPNLNDRIHCVCILLDGSTVDDLPEKMLTKLKTVQAKIRDRSIPMRVLLTKIDKISPKVNEDTSMVFKSRSVKQKVEAVSELLGVPANNVLLVKNYESETQLKTKINVLALVSLKALLDASMEFFENYMDKAESKLCKCCVLRQPTVFPDNSRS